MPLFSNRRPPSTDLKVKDPSEHQVLMPSRPTRTSPSALLRREVPPRPPVVRWTAVGIVIAGVFFGGFGAWAALAPLSSAAVAPGIVVVESSRKTVDHWEGGIIQEIKVREGEVVQAGQPLVTLATTQAESQRDALRGELVRLWAAEARLKALLTDAEAPVFPPQLVERAEEPEVASILRDQENRFTGARRTLEGTVAGLEKTIDQLQAQIQGFEQIVDGYDRQLRGLREQREDTETLLREQLVRKSQLIDIDRQIADITARRGNTLAQIEQANQAIEEARIQILTVQDEFRGRQGEELDTVRSRAAELQQSLRAAQDVLDRHVIAAPVTGIINELHYHTVGGTVAPGQPILDIVPLADQLMIQARISPLDIDEVHPGLPVEVRLTSFGMRNTPSVPGELVTVSADLLQDERTGQPYFDGLIRLDEAALAAMPSNIKLYPGMPADAMIKLRERTFVDYILAPFEQSLHRAFRES